VLERFGPRLPFLLKVLAAAEPLSLQAHPSAARAAAGFADEEARGVPSTRRTAATATPGRNRSCSGR
jgi:mannose-6-phosphate isomerase class I